jgi:O-antigen/teichoic acid export membrane protein
VAIFDLAARLTLLVNFLIDGLNSAIAPNVFSLMREPASERQVKELNKYCSAFNLVTLLAIPFNILMLPIILPLFINDVKYLEAFIYFGIICSGFAVRGITNLYMFPILFQKKTSRLILINGAAAAMQLGLGYVMVRYFKLYGAAYTLIAVKVALVIMAAWWCRDMWMAGFNKMKMVVLPASVILVIGVSELFISEYGMMMHLIHLAETILIVSMSYIIYRSEIADLYQNAMKKVKAAV